MANESLNEPVTVEAFGIMASSLPAGFSPVYIRYVLSQAMDFGKVADKANDAGQGAYDAQVKNDEQDIELKDHEDRITILRLDVDGHELRITANTNAISLLNVRLTTAEGQIVTLRSDVDYLIDDYVSKSETSPQSLNSPLNVATSYSVGGVKVIGSRVTGFTPATGSVLKGAFNANQSYPTSSLYTQSEAQAMASGLVAARQRIKALEDAMRLHGLID